MRRLPFGVLTGCWVVCSMLVLPLQAQMPMPVIPPMPGPVPMPGNLPEEGAAVTSRPVEGMTEVPDTARPRDPFWPVGYVPKKNISPAKGGSEVLQGAPMTRGQATPEPVRGPDWDAARKKMDIRGISLIHEKNSQTPKYLAMISGKLVETGDVVTVKYDERTYRWRVVTISPDGVSLQKLDVHGE